MKRREFIALVGGAAAVPMNWPRAADAQRAGIPVVGLLDSRSPDGLASRLLAFRQGLKETGASEGVNVVLDFRWAEGQFDRLPGLAADLVRRQVAVIATSGGAAVAFAAKAATTTIPIVFTAAEDPVRLGLVTSLARPAGNLTGINFLIGELTAKRFDLLRELVPAATRVGVLVNPDNASTTESTLREVEPAARATGLQIKILQANSSRKIDAAFATFVREPPDAVFVGNDAFFNTRRVQLALLAGRHGVPAIYSDREYAEAGGLMTYGSDLKDAYRQMGIYVGRLLKGAKPAYLPIVQSTKFELIINHQTARMLGITVPQTLLTSADEVIE